MSNEELEPAPSPNLLIINRTAELKASIRAAIRAYDPDGCVTYVEEQMASSLSEFVLDAVRKFVRGQREHGGDFRNLDHVAEMRQEQMDFFWYNEGNKWKTKSSHLPA